MAIFVFALKKTNGNRCVHEWRVEKYGFGGGFTQKSNLIKNWRFPVKIEAFMPFSGLK